MRQGLDRVDRAAQARRGGVLLLVLGLLAAGALPAAASVWCGENGLFRFSFAEGDSLVETLSTGEPQGGLTIVDVYGWLTDVTPVARNGDAFLRVGGVELKLAVSGAAATVIGQDFPDPKALNVGTVPGTVAAGFHPGLRLQAGKVLLVHWKLMFEGRPVNVRLGLEAAALRSCDGLEGCRESGTQALYAGATTANQLDCLFGAGYAPAWLNPEGEPDRAPVRGRSTWQDAGVFQAR